MPKLSCCTLLVPWTTTLENTSCNQNKYSVLWTVQCSDMKWYKFTWYNVISSCCMPCGSHSLCRRRQIVIKKENTVYCMLLCSDVKSCHFHRLHASYKIGFPHSVYIHNTTLMKAMYIYKALHYLWKPWNLESQMRISETIL